MQCMRLLSFHVSSCLKYKLWTIWKKQEEKYPNRCWIFKISDEVIEVLHAQFNFSAQISKNILSQVANGILYSYRDSVKMWWWKSTFCEIILAILQNACHFKRLDTTHGWPSGCLILGNSQRKCLLISWGCEKGSKSPWALYLTWKLAMQSLQCQWPSWRIHSGTKNLCPGCYKSLLSSICDVEWSALLNVLLTTMHNAMLYSSDWCLWLNSIEATILHDSNVIVVSCISALWYCAQCPISQIDLTFYLIWWISS